MTGPGATIHRLAPLRACAPLACRDCGMYRLCAPLGLERGDFSLLDTVLRRKLTYRRGELLYRAGAPLEYLFAIRGGSVKTYIPAGNGRFHVTGFHVAGEVLGLNAIDGRRHPSEARALETTSVCALSIERFEQLARREPAIQREVIRIMSADIRRHQEQLLLLGKRNAEERLAAYLLSLSRCFAERRLSASEFHLSMSRGDIGSYLGIAEETVCRVLARFQKQGVLVMRRRYVRLLDLGRLRAIARDPGARPS